MAEENLPLIPLPGAGLTDSRSNGGRIVSEMVGSALALTQSNQVNPPVILHHKVGDHWFCDPDYRQLVVWATDLGLMPEKVVQHLLRQSILNEAEVLLYDIFGEMVGTCIENGRFLDLQWDLSALPVEQMNWVPGLKMKRVRIACSSSPDDKPQTISSLRVPLSELNDLQCRRIGLRQIDLSSALGLERLDCSFNRLTTLDLGSVPELKELNARNNWLLELRLPSDSQLTKLDVTRNELVSLDCATAPSLKQLSVSRNRLKKLELTGATHLTKLHCHTNQLTDLDLRNVPSLTILVVSDNQLSDLDLSAVPLLTELRVDKNHLSELDIRPLVNLKSLSYDNDKTCLIQRPDQHF